MYVLIENNTIKQYPYNINDLRLDNPQISFPQNITTKLLATFNVFPVTPTDRPQYDPASQKIEEGAPIKVNQRWQQTWNIVTLTLEEQNKYQHNLQENIIAQTQKRLDKFAQIHNYDGILSACTYATSTVPKFQLEGQYCVAFRDATWAKLYEILAEIESGIRPIPTGFMDIEADLPHITWPN